MRRIILTFFASLIVLSSALACMTAKPNSALILDPVPEVNLTGPVYELPAPPVTLNSIVSGFVDGIKFVTHHTVHTAAALPQHAAHAPRLVIGTCYKGGEVANGGAVKAKQAAAEGMNGFSTLTSFLLRIAYSSFSALISGILRS